MTFPFLYSCMTYQSSLAVSHWEMEWTQSTTVALRGSCNTAVGQTEEKETGENIGQGTLEGANISAANIDYTVNMFFQTSMDELSYGGERLQPLLFQDNISRLSTSVREAQTGNTWMESLMETKLLDFNLDKSCFAKFKNGEISRRYAEFSWVSW